MKKDEMPQKGRRYLREWSLRRFLLRTLSAVTAACFMSTALAYPSPAGLLKTRATRLTPWSNFDKSNPRSEEARHGMQEELERRAGTAGQTALKAADLIESGSGTRRTRRIILDVREDRVFALTTKAGETYFEEILLEVLLEGIQKGRTRLKRGDRRARDEWKDVQKLRRKAGALGIKEEDIKRLMGKRGLPIDRLRRLVAEREKELARELAAKGRRQEASQGTSLGAAELRSLGAKAGDADRAVLLAMIRGDGPVFIVHKGSSGRFEVSMNTEFFEPTLSPESIEKLLEMLQDFIDRTPGAGEFFSKPEHARRYLDFYLLSDFQFWATQLRHEEKGISVRREVREIFERYFMDAFKGRLSEKEVLQRDEPPRHRKMALEWLARHGAANGFHTEKPLLIPKAAGEAGLKRVVLNTEATAEDWKDPSVMIVHERGYQAKDWRPNEEGGLYPGEYIVVARWQGRYFLLYTSRSHTARGVQIHQWRNTWLLQGGRFEKSSILESLDDLPGPACILLDELIYSGKMKFEKGGAANLALRDNQGKINNALLGWADYEGLAPPFRAWRARGWWSVGTLTGFLRGLLGLYSKEQLRQLAAGQGGRVYWHQGWWFMSRLALSAFLNPAALELVAEGYFLPWTLSGWLTNDIAHKTDERMNWWGRLLSRLARLLGKGETGTGSGGTGTETTSPATLAPRPASAPAGKAAVEVSVSDDGFTVTDSGSGMGYLSILRDLLIPHNSSKGARSAPLPVRTNYQHTPGRSVALPLADLIAHLYQATESEGTLGDIFDGIPRGSGRPKHWEDILQLEIQRFPEENRPVIELIANAIDATNGKGGAIGRFGVGFLNTLKYLRGEGDRVVVTTSNGTEAFRIVFQLKRGKIWIQISALDPAKIRKGTSVTVRVQGRSFSSKELTAMVKGYYRFNRHLPIVIGNNGKVETVNDPSAYGRFAHGGVTMFYARQKAQGRGRVVILKQGVKILEFEAAGYGIPAEAAIELPPGAGITMARNQFELSTEAESDLKGFIDYLLQKRDRMPLLNVLYSFLVKQGNGSVLEYLEKAIEEKWGDGTLVLPDVQSFHQAFGDRAVYVHPKLFSKRLLQPLALEQFPLPKKFQGKYQVYLASLGGGIPFVEFGNCIIFNRAPGDATVNQGFILAHLVALEFKESQQNGFYADKIKLLVDLTTSIMSWVALSNAKVHAALFTPKSVSARLRLLAGRILSFFRGCFEAWRVRREAARLARERAPKPLKNDFSLSDLYHTFLAGPEAWSDALRSIGRKGKLKGARTQRRSARNQIAHTINSQNSLEHVFIREFIQNALDADATIMGINPQEGGFLFQDNGKGMTLQDLLQYLLLPFTSTKRGASGKIGKFGQGFFTALKDARELKITSSTGDGQVVEVRLVPVREKSDVVDVRVSISIRKGSEVDRGTAIVWIPKDPVPVLEMEAHARGYSRLVYVPRGSFKIEWDPMSEEGSPAILNESKEPLAERQTPYGPLRIYQADGVEPGILHGGFYVGALSDEVAGMIPASVLALLKHAGLMIDLPRGIQLVTDRSDLAHKDQVLPQIRQPIWAASLAAFVRIAVTKRLGPWNFVPYDFFESGNTRQALLIPEEIRRDGARLGRGESIDPSVYEKDEAALHMLLQSIPAARLKGHPGLYSLAQIALLLENGAVQPEAIEDERLREHVIQARMSKLVEAGGFAALHKEIGVDLSEEEVEIKRPISLKGRTGRQPQLRVVEVFEEFSRRLLKLLYPDRDIQVGFVARKRGEVAESLRGGDLMGWDVRALEKLLPAFQELLSGGNLTDEESMVGLASILEALSHEATHMLPEYAESLYYVSWQDHDDRFFAKQRQILARLQQRGPEIQRILEELRRLYPLGSEQPKIGHDFIVALARHLLDLKRGGAMKAIGERDPMDEDSLRPSEETLGTWRERAANEPIVPIADAGISAKLVVVEAMPEGIFAYHFPDEAGNLVIVVRKDYQDEGAFHEAREAHWIAQGLSQADAHRLASAEQALKFGDGGITPFHQAQLNGMTEVQLKAIVEEDRQAHHDLIRQYLEPTMPGALERVMNYEAALRDQARAMLNAAIKEEVRSDLKKDHGIDVIFDGILDTRSVPPDADWVMRQIRDEEKGPIVTDPGSMPEADLVYPLEACPVLSEKGSSGILYLGIARVNGKEQPVVLKRARSFSYPETEELISAQIFDRLGVGPRFYGVIRDAYGTIIGYAMQLVLGEDLNGRNWDAATDADMREIRERFQRVGGNWARNRVDQYMKTRSGRVVAIDAGGTLPEIDPGELVTFVRRMNETAAPPAVLTPAAEPLPAPAPGEEAVEEAA